MIYEKTINVNELNDILQKYFKVKKVYIEVVEVADLEDQHNPLKYRIGIGGVCNVTFQSSRRLR